MGISSRVYSVTPLDRCFGFLYMFLSLPPSGYYMFRISRKRTGVNRCRDRRSHDLHLNQNKESSVWSLWFIIRPLLPPDTTWARLIWFEGWTERVLIVPVFSGAWPGWSGYLRCMNKMWENCRWAMSVPGKGIHNSLSFICPFLNVGWNRIWL